MCSAEQMCRKMSQTPESSPARRLHNCGKWAQFRLALLNHPNARKRESEHAGKAGAL
jgi:hypothetical protein